ncbi:carbonic anhydrase [Ideonella paludis]|uniref:carbonic anhydrase n=2 Tax=Ideonella paludis TaxID=1233411 RepID=A0ABS5DWW6_9BURK|nr:carbonic anhydrase family protein [Ideonella paludis]MBQ0935569.1 carbonic anhydrase family protein [Ideonella paludis]
MKTSSTLSRVFALAAVSAAVTSAWASDAAHAPAKAPTAARAAPAPAAKPGASPESMDALRQKLAERLGASQPPEVKHPNVMRVTNPATHADAQVASPKPAPAAAAHGAGHAPAKKRSAPAAPKDAAHGGGAHSAAAGHAAHWAYQGPGGPEVWGQLKPEFSKCSTGQRQSPIDIRSGIQVQLEAIEFDYQPTGFSVVDNGHTVQVNLPPGNAITVMGRRYDLLQFHFHRPSEERINGRQFDMVAHLVHKDAEGRLAVVAVLLDRGASQPVIQNVWNALPLEKGEEQAAPSVIDLKRLLPEDKRYFTYMGSLTTPPCSEGVLWMVMKTPVNISPEQINIFARLYPMNARPIQQVSGRLIKESN